MTAQTKHADALLEVLASQRAALRDGDAAMVSRLASEAEELATVLVENEARACRVTAAALVRSAELTTALCEVARRAVTRGPGAYQADGRPLRPALTPRKGKQL